MSYSELLKDPRWQKKRLEILDRDNFTCTVCGDSRETLHVHHKRYSGSPWDSSNEDLSTLCRWCHEQESGRGSIIGTIELPVTSSPFNEKRFQKAVSWLRDECIRIKERR